MSERHCSETVADLQTYFLFMQYSLFTRTFLPTSLLYRYEIGRLTLAGPALEMDYCSFAFQSLVDDNRLRFLSHRHFSSPFL